MSVDVGLFLQGQLGTSGNNTLWAYPGAVPENLDQGNFFGPVSNYLRVGDRIFLPRAELTVTEKVQNVVRVALVKAVPEAGGDDAPPARGASGVERGFRHTRGSAGAGPPSTRGRSQGSPLRGAS